jgi:myo-inositol-1(or 4)-monophosphatase
MTLDLTQVQTVIIDLARKAGEILLHYQEAPLNLMTKSNVFDVVTEADKQSEALIVKELTAHFPDHHIVGEEGGGQGAPIEQAPYRWYVDPVDGTTNFANKIPYFCVSIGMTDATMNSLVGVVYNPVTNELFTAVRGQGATLNGKPIHVSEKDTLETSVLACGFPYARHEIDESHAMLGRMNRLARGMRCMGAAALDFSYVAAGRFDGYYEAHLKPWDASAGVLLVREAGGLVTNFQGETPADLIGTGWMIASNGKIHTAIMDALKQ